MRAWRSRVILLSAIVLLPLEAVLIIWIWPYSHIIAEAIVALLVVCCACLGAYALAFTWHGIGILAARKRRENLHSRLIEASGVVVLAQEDGTYAHLSAQHESAKLALPAPVQVSEVTTGEAEPDHWRILELAGKGMDLRSIALACNTSYYHVQRITSAWKKKLKESG